MSRIRMNLSMMPIRRHLFRLMRRQSTLSSLLKPGQIEFIEQEKLMFDKMYKNFSKLGASKDTLNLIADSKSKIDDLFMV